MSLDERPPSGGDMQVNTSAHDLTFDDRACFIAGPAKSGTTLLVALLDGHPQLLVFPQDTAYFPTALTKYGPGGRRAQFDYLTQHSWARGLFGYARARKANYANFPQQAFLDLFERTAFDPANKERDLLVLLFEAYAELFHIPLDRIQRWVEKTPANRNYVPQIFARFPCAKLLVTMRDPRALLAAQIHLEEKRKTGRFSTYYVMAHWLQTARLTQKVRAGEVPGMVVSYEELVRNPDATMKEVCQYLEINFDPQIVLKPTKAGRDWAGNSSAGIGFSEISTEPVTRWERELSEDEIGWVEWHCRDLMPGLGYEPRLHSRSFRHWIKPIVGERPREFLKSRVYSMRDALRG